MAAATLTFPSQTLLKNVVDPVDGTDAATKEYVDNSLSGGGSSIGAAGSDTQIQYNDSGKLGASANLTFDSSLEVFTVIGNIVSSNANLGNAASANFFIGDGGLLSNIYSVGGTADFATTANFANYAGNVTISDQPNITSVGDLVNLTVTGNANIQGTTNSTGIETGALIVAGGMSVSQDVWVGGNLYVNNVIAETHTTLDVTDPLLYLSTDTTYPYSYEIGFYSHFSLTGPEPGNGYQHTGLVRYHADNAWYLFSNIPEPRSGTVDLANVNIVYDNLKLGDIIAFGNANITSAVTSDSVTANTVNVNVTLTSNNTNTTNLSVSGNTITLNTANIVVSAGNAGIFTTGISNVNIGLAANVTLGSTSGTTTVRGNLSANNISVNSVAVANIYNNTSSIAVTTDTLIDSFPTSLYRSAKYIITANNADGYQSQEALLLHDDFISFVTIYGSLSTAFEDADIITLSSNIVSGNVCLYATGSTSSTKVNLLSTYVTD